MWRGKEFAAALCVTGAALGADFVTGRAHAAFYAQMGSAAWAGVLFSGAAFGGIIFFFACMARRAGAGNMHLLMGRMPGGRMGKGSRFIYALLITGAAYMMISGAVWAGALILPVKNAAFLSGAMAFALALTLSLSGARGMCVFCGGVCLTALLFELALLFFAPPVRTERLLFELELRLRDNLPMALFFALIHAALSACVGAGAALVFGAGGARPAPLGGMSGGLFCLLLILGNCALTRQSEKILALKTPFAAISAAWGTAGFYICAILMFLASVAALSSLFCALLPRKMMLNYENLPPFH